jgi:hypothetical protein
MLIRLYLACGVLAASLAVMAHAHACAIETIVHISASRLMVELSDKLDYQARPFLETRVLDGGLHSFFPIPPTWKAGDRVGVCRADTEAIIVRLEDASHIQIGNW